MIKSFVKISILTIALVAALGISQARAKSSADCDWQGPTASNRATEYGCSYELPNGATQPARDADTGQAKILDNRPYSTYSREPSNYRGEP